MAQVQEWGNWQLHGLGTIQPRRWNQRSLLSLPSWCWNESELGFARGIIWSWDKIMDKTSGFSIDVDAGLPAGFSWIVTRVDTSLIWQTRSKVCSLSCIRIIICNCLPRILRDCQFMIRVTNHKSPSTLSSPFPYLCSWCNLNSGGY